MKVSKYFKFRRKLADRVSITNDWIRSVIENPLKTETQDDGRIKMWGKIREAGDRYLRVVILEDGETVHNAFFDRKFKE